MFTYRLGSDPVAELGYQFRPHEDEPDRFGTLSITIKPYDYFTGDPLPIRYASIILRDTPAQFGGRRQWFECPGCNARCRVLYGYALRCHRCAAIAYQSQSMTPSDRASHQMGKICKRLDPRFDGSADELPDKPTGMHWRTYDRFADRHGEYQQQWEAGLLSSQLVRRMFGL